MGLSFAFSAWAREYYQAQREHKGHQAAVRALAFKWIRILFRCWKDRTPYDEPNICKHWPHASQNNHAIFHRT